MAFSFDGVSKIITLTGGTTELDVKDLYSRWKDWTGNGGAPYLQAMSVVGGDPIDEANGIYVSTYVFLENGWKVRPQEANHKLKVINGILLTSTGEDPFIQTQGYYNVLIQYSQPVATQSVVVETGTSGLTTEESNQLAEISTVNTKTNGLSSDLLTQTNTLSSTILADNLLHSLEMSSTILSEIASQTTLLVSYMKNKKYLSKEGNTWYLIIRDTDNLTNILKKALKDKDGNNITDIVAGALAQELASSV